MTEVLFISVGGSPQPIATAIRERQWARVVFVVSDGADGSQSSDGQVVDKEILYDKRHGGRGPGLKYLEETPGDIGIIRVRADDLDTALSRIDTALSSELANGHRVTVDYTGGTKTMTAAMVLAATGHEGVRVQFMSGKRQDLSQVEAGTEKPVEMPGELLGLARLFAQARTFVKSRQYQAALGIVFEANRAIGSLSRSAGPKPPKSWRKRIDDWTRWLKVMDAWDRFEHADADKQLQDQLDLGVPWARDLEEQGFAGRLTELAGNEKGPSPALLEDLWLNAERRAAIGLYDDATARLYRLAEACIQVRLASFHGIDTGRVPVSILPSDIAEKSTRKIDKRTGEESYELGLFRSLELLERLSPSDEVVGKWDKDDGGRFLPPEWQRLRNRSILAHGFTPLDEKSWRRAREWFTRRKKELWEELTDRPTAAQLPDHLPF